jgi:predicted Zn-dependent peptidase
MPKQFHTHQLSNGLRVVIEVMPHVDSAAAGFLSRTGARDETRATAGVSHYLEHMCFKGTPKRDWAQINIAFDEMAGDYNAFTSKQRTFYYGWVRASDIDRQIELLADEFTTEKQVILEEIAMSNDRLEHLVIDLLHEKVFGDHPLSWPVLGYDTTVQDLSRDTMADYFSRRYAPDNLILFVAGNVDPDAIVATVERLCGDWTPGGAVTERTAGTIHTGSTCQQVDRFNQQCVALVFASPGGLDPVDETAEATASILGGSNSRMFWNVVQEGVAPRAGAFRMEYVDCGMMILYGMCDPEHCEKLVDALRREAATMSAEGVKTHEVDRVRNRRRTSLAVEAEAPYYRLVQLMDDVDVHGRPMTVDERLERVDAITVESVRDYLDAYPITGDGYAISVGPRDWTVR